MFFHPEYIDATTFEFTKMAVDPDFRRKGIAEAISYASFEKAKTLGAQKVILYSNTKNAAAIKLYEKLGFKHLQPETGVYARANVKMEIDITEALAAVKKLRQKIIVHYLDKKSTYQNN